MKRGEHPNSQKNLKPIKKGQVLNPKGKPKGALNFMTHIKRALDREVEQKDPITQEKTKKTIMETVGYKLIACALKGEQWAVKELLDRVDGKVPQKNEHDVSPIPIVNLTGKDLEKVIKKMMEEDDC